MRNLNYINESENLQTSNLDEFKNLDCVFILPHGSGHNMSHYYQKLKL